MICMKYFIFPAAPEAGIYYFIICIEIASPESDITREGAMRAFTALRAQAEDNGVADMNLDDRNNEIRLA